MKTKAKEKTAYIIAFLGFLGYSIWWLINFISGETDTRSHEIYSDSYWVLALIGAVFGIFVARQWGGFKSSFGRALYLFSLGLLAQVFGQVTYTYFAWVQNVEAPYPSIGDIGYFGSIILYALGAIVLSRAVGAKFSLASIPQRTVAILLPAALLVASYAIFLKDYEFTGDKLITFLDFGYPLGQAFYLAIALFMYVVSFKLLGGIMKNKILLLLFALLIQYLADFLFLYQYSREEWYPGNFSDYLYQVAYLMMTLALLWIGSTARKLSSRGA